MGMEILAYQELKEKNTLLPLMEQAFGWPFDPTEVEKSIRADPRLRDGSVGFCALKEGKAIGYAGVMDLTLGTVAGTEERVGGLYAVATFPGYTRQGVCTALMNRAHEYFVSKGYRFSLLTTSPTIVAHALYRKLDYFDVASFPSAYKVRAKAEKPEALEHRGVSKWDYDGILERFREYVKGRTGFVIRDKTYLRMLIKQHEISAKECVMTERGYVIFKREKKQVRVRELVAHNQKEMNRLIGLVENKAQRAIIGRLGVENPAVSRAYASRGFTVLETGHGVLMAKELVAGASFNDSFGSRFYMSALDHF